MSATPEVDLDSVEQPDRLRGARRWFDRNTAADELLRHLEAFGVAKLSAFYDLTTIVAVRHGFQSVYADRAQRAARGELPPKLQKHFKGGSVILQDIPVGAGSAVDGLMHPVLSEVARAFLGHSPQPSQSSFVRTIRPGPDGNEMPFHQDASVLGAPLLNVWVPLNPCGEHAPGLEVVATDRKALLTTSGPEASPRVVVRKQIAVALLAEQFGEDAFWHPQFEPGDAFVFLGSTVHRTYSTPTMTQPRTSAELRLV